MLCAISVQYTEYKWKWLFTYFMVTLQDVSLWASKGRGKGVLSYQTEFYIKLYLVSTNGFLRGTYVVYYWFFNIKSYIPANSSACVFKYDWRLAVRMRERQVGWWTVTPLSYLHKLYQGIFDMGYQSMNTDYIVQ